MKTIPNYAGDLLQSNDGRLFRKTDASEKHLCNLEWAQSLLAAPDVIWINGKHSHVVAARMLEKAEDHLLNWRVFQAG